MVQKVSKQNKIESIDNIEKVNRSSVSKNTVDSFSKTIAKKVKTLSANGESLNNISKKLNIPADMLNNIVKEAHDKESNYPKCDCENIKEEPSNEKKESDKAYEALYNRSLDKKTYNENIKKTVILGGSLKDTGSSHKCMGSDSKPTIFSPDALDKIAKQMDNGEKIRKENERIEQHRIAEKKKYETIDGKDLKEALNDTINSKASSVSSACGNESYKYSKKIQSNGMSIFDDGDFSKIDKSAGEKMSESLKKEKEEKEKNSKNIFNENKSYSSKDITQRLFDNIFNSKE